MRMSDFFRCCHLSLPAANGLAHQY
uniref:Uncharacterized protein n=1 Tax=Musa acuminata subsp. malaccensis TaxID=214687 RepID=A0A804HQ23_MUSAM